MPLSDDDLLSSFLDKGAAPAPESADPAPVTPADDPLTSFMASRAAKARAVGALGTNPDAAAKAIGVAKQTGLPPAVVSTDPEGFGQQAKVEEANKHLDNPHLQRFVNEVPGAAELSSDDWAAINGVSQSLNWLSPEGHEKKVNASLFASSPGLKAVLGFADNYAERIRKNRQLDSDAFWSAFQGGSAVDSIMDEMEKTFGVGTRTMWEYSMIPTGARALEGMLRGVVGATKMTGSMAAGQLTELGVQDIPTALGGPKYGDAEAKFRQGVSEVIDAELAREAGEVPVHVFPAPAAAQNLSVEGFLNIVNGARTKGEINEFLRQQTTGKYDPAAFTGNPELQREVALLKEKAAGVVPEPKNSVEVHSAEIAAESVSNAVAAAQESKLRERAPEVFEKLIETKGELGSVHLDPEAVLKLYKAAGRAPAEGDGLLGFVPDLLRKTQLATETGGEVAIPLSKYIAHIDPSVHEKLLEDLRLHDGGTTLKEAELLKHTEPMSEVHPPVVDYLHSLQPEAFEQIKTAANKYGENIYPGVTHGEALMAAKAAGEDIEKHTPENEGFLTTTGRFVNREDAMTIARRHGQGITEDLDATELIAEDLVPPDQLPKAPSAIEKEMAAEESLKATKKAEAAKAAEAPEEEPPLVEEEPTAPVVKAEDLAPTKEEKGITRARPGANTKRLAQLLGPKLYGDPTDMDLVSVKEMMQNSFDALKTSLQRGEIKDPKIEIKFDQKKRSITLTDNGSGMTAETLGGPFLRIADTLKETENSSGGFGIAKMLFLFGNKELQVTTMRLGRVSTLTTTGEQLFNALEDESLAPPIHTAPATKEHKKLFPEGHGTQVTVTLPESFKDPSTGEQKKIEFRSDEYWHRPVMKSPLFHPIEVTWNEGYGASPLPIGKNFPHDEFTQFANVKFDWGTARIYITKQQVKVPSYEDNVSILSNGIFQFGVPLKKNPREPYGDNVQKQLYIDVDSKALPTDPGYPFDLNRQGFISHAKKDLAQILNYISARHQEEDFATAVKNFGDIQYFDEKGMPGPKQLLAPKLPPTKTTLTEIKEGENVEVRDGKLIVRGREVKELSPGELRASDVRLDELMIPQSEVNPDRVILHDNLELLKDKDYVSLVDAAREKFGARFDSYVFGIGDKMRELRDLVANVMHYPALREEGVGISFDQEYRGVSIKIPFSGMFLNPAVPRYTDPVQAAVGMVGTMIHEFAHHKVRSHDADFPAEMQDIIIKLDALEHLEAQRTALGEPFFSLVKFKEDVINHVKKHHDILEWLNQTVIAEGTGPEGQPLVRNRGKRFKDAGSRQAADVGVPGRAEEPTEAVSSGYEGFRPAFEPIGEGEGPSRVPEEPRSGNPELDRLTDEVNKNKTAVKEVVAAKRERRALYLDPLLTKGATLNIDQQMYKRYSDLIEKNQLRILTKAIDFAKKRIGKERSAEWEAEREKMRPEVEREILRRPDWAADRFFNWEKGVLPSGQKIVSTFFKEMSEAKADEWAPVFGFDTGSQMTTAVLALEAERTDAGKGPRWQLKQHVNAEIERRMDARHGSLQDAIAIEASEEALADWNVDLLEQEIKMLAAAHGVEPPLTRADLKAWIADKFGTMDAKGISFERARKSTEKNGKEVEKELLKGSIEGALMAAQKRAKAFYMAQEAKKFERERARAEKLFNKYAHAVTLRQVDQAYTDQIQALLTNRGYKVRRDKENIEYNLAGKTLQNFIDEKKAMGRLIVQAELPEGKQLSDFTVDEFRDFTTMIQSMDHNGRFEKYIEVKGRIEEQYKVMDTIYKNLDKLEREKFDPDAKGPISALRRVGRYIDASLLKAERLIDWIDRNDPMGMLNQVVYRPLIEAEQKIGDMTTLLSKKALEMPGDRAWSHGLYDLTNNKELYDWEDPHGKLMKLNRENMIAIALNYGNRGNRDVLLRGYKWTPEAVEAFLERNMKPMDWKMVNALHDLFSPLAPHVERVTRERAGVAVPLVAPEPFMDSKGGYYPLLPDPKQKRNRTRVETDLFDKVIYDPLPTAPALKRRTGSVYKLNLSLNSIHHVLSQTTHAVFMQTPVVNANKVLKDQLLREGIDASFGPEYNRLLDRWLKDIANNGGSDDDAMLAWLSRSLRENVVTALMGYKVSTAVIHGVSAGASSLYELGKMNLEEIGPMSFAAAPLELTKNIAKLGLGNLPPIARRFFANDSNFMKMYNEVQEQSGEMRNRQRNLQKDFGFQMQKILQKNIVDDLGYYRTLHQAYSMALVAYVDLLTATPVYIAVRDKELLKGTSLADAIYIADKAVREAHGSASLVARANVGRGEIGKWLTIAYNGYWNHNYNKWRSEMKLLTYRPSAEVGLGPQVLRSDEASATSDADSEGLTMGMKIALGAAFMTALVVVPSLVHYATRGKEEKTLGGAIASMGVSQVAGTVPIVNSLMYSIIHNRDPVVSPIEDVMKSATEVWKDAMVRKHAKHPVAHAFRAGSMILGAPPTNQFIDTSSFMWDVLTDKKQPESIGQWARGILAVGDKGKGK